MTYTAERRPVGEGATVLKLMMGRCFYIILIQVANMEDILIFSIFFKNISICPLTSLTSVNAVFDDDTIELKF